MRKMTEEDQGCFMLISEAVQPELRLAYPSSSKILAGTVAWIVNKLAQSETMAQGMESLFGETEMLAHAITNVSAVTAAKKYPGNLFPVINYVPVGDKIVQWQITVCVEYIVTELLALAGANAIKVNDQEQFKSEKRGCYEDYPQIRPVDLKAAVKGDADLKVVLGGLFKV